MTETLVTLSCFMENQNIEYVYEFAFSRVFMYGRNMTKMQIFGNFLHSMGHIIVEHHLHHQN